MIQVELRRKRSGAKRLDGEKSLDRARCPERVADRGFR